MSQGSGSGKSKLSVELIKDGPGFYIVLRNEGSTGYPENNDLSQEFITLTRSPDSLVNLTDFDYRNCNIGKMLFLLASILTFYLRDWYTLVADYITKMKVDPEITCSFDLYQDAARNACAELGKLFDSNKNIDCDVFKNDEVKNRIFTAAKRKFGELDKVKLPTVDGLAEYIKDILANPPNAIDNKSQINNDAIVAMKACLEAFPFVFIFDEADQLNDNKTQAFSSGFEHLRRALSYLIPSTNVFFLTLGTKSTVHDLNPTPRDDSKRYQKRNKLFSPILLLSNGSIFFQGRLSD